MNGAYGSRSHGENMSDRDDIIRDEKFLDTLDRRGNRHRYYSSSGSDRHYDCHRYHPYKRSDRGYLLGEFKKAKLPTFDGEMRKSQDEEAWFLSMKKFFRWHDYSETMKSIIATFSVKGREGIWWEDVKNV